MALPTTRTEFKEYCLRKLGKPVIEINVDDTQVEDRIDEAMELYFDYHMNGSNKVFYKYQITNTDKENGYITLPNNFLSVVRVLVVSVGAGHGDAGMFNPEYQFALSEFHNIGENSIIPYYMGMERISMLDFLLSSANPIRFNRHENKLYIDTNWDKFETGKYIVVEAYVELDESANPDIWKDKWLLDYATALIKMQWGMNLIKYEGLQLPGGTTLNGRQIYDDAKEEIERLKEELKENYQLPPDDFIG